jgi:hypothetical protein
MSRTKPKDFDSDRAAGWAQPREVKDEPPARSLSNQGAIIGWVAKASARSGVKFSLGTGSSAK